MSAATQVETVNYMVKRGVDGSGKDVYFLYWYAVGARHWACNIVSIVLASMR